MVAYQNPIVFFLVIPTNATTGARIVLDGINGFLLVYDANNALIGSIAGRDGTDSLGNPVFRGLVDYDHTNKFIATQLDQGEIRFLYLNYAVGSYIPGAMGPTNPGASTTAPGALQIASPSLNGDHRAVITLDGTSIDGTATPEVLMLATDGTQLEVAIQGILTTFGFSGWNDVSFAANWTNFGNGFGNVRYRIIPDGFIAMQGMAMFTGGATGASIQLFTFPVGFRPDRSINMGLQDSPGTTTNPATFTFQFGTNGVVSITNFAGTITSGHLFSFEGLAFSVSSATTLP